MVNTGHCVEKNVPVFEDLGTEESDAEKGKGGTDDSTYET